MQHGFFLLYAAGFVYVTGLNVGSGNFAASGIGTSSTAAPL